MNGVTSSYMRGADGRPHKASILAVIAPLLAAEPKYTKNMHILTAFSASYADVPDRDPGYSPPCGDDPGDVPPGSRDPGSMPPDLEDLRKFDDMHVPQSLLPDMGGAYLPESILPLDESYRPEIPEPEPYGPYFDEEENGICMPRPPK